MFRLSRDDRGLDAAVKALHAAAAVDLGDYFRFEHLDTRGEWHEGATCRVRYSVYFGAREAGAVGVDVVTNLRPHGVPYSATLDLPFAIEVGPDPVPDVRMWPLEDHTADKIAAMYERHRGHASSRYKDLVDLVLVALRAELDGATTHAALHSEVARRRNAGVDITLPSRFTVPERTSWRRGYQAEAGRMAALAGTFRTLDDCEPLIDRFVTRCSALMLLARGTRHKAHGRPGSRVDWQAPPSGEAYRGAS